MTAVDFDFLMANQAVAALENRATSLSTIRPTDLATLSAIRSCVAAADALRAAFRFPSEASWTPPTRRRWRRWIELEGRGVGEAPLADWAPGEHEASERCTADS